MTRSPLVWIGLAGVEPDDNPRALAWQARLHRVMAGIALLALPAYFLASLQPGTLGYRIATLLDALIFAAFLAETIWMTYLSSHRARYLVENWLNHVVIVGALASLLGAATEWVALVRVVRVAIAGMVFAQAIVSVRELFTQRGAPLLVGATVLIMLVIGGLFYWFEPTVHDYWEGLWLAFVTGTTIGYGDYVPTTGQARVLAVFTALVGFALVTLFTASVVTFFVGRDEAQARDAIEREMAELKGSLERLVATEEIRFREDLHRDVNQLRRQIAELLHAEELQFRKQFQHEIAALRADVAALRAQLAQREAGEGGAPFAASERA